MKHPVYEERAFNVNFGDLELFVISLKKKKRRFSFSKKYKVQPGNMKYILFLYFLFQKGTVIIFTKIFDKIFFVFFLIGLMGWRKMTEVLKIAKNE